MLMYVRFLLTAQVDVSVELLGVLEKWVRVGARPWWMATGEARGMEEQSEVGDVAPPPSSCTPLSALRAEGTARVESGHGLGARRGSWSVQDFVNHYPEFSFFS